ncbi:MAG: pentapeptide repeat-containing protein [Cyanobacteria bacterium P01_H01_bin.150]
MPLDYSGQNLRGRSFKGQNLEGANFSYADIRGTNFTEANLKGANFTGAKAGLQKRWVFLLLLLSWLLSGISGYLSLFNTISIAYVFDSSQSVENQFAGWLAMIVTIILYIIIIRQGISVSLAFAITGAVAVAVAVAGAIALAGAGDFAFAVGLSFVFTFAIAGAFAIAFAFAVSGLFGVVGALTIGGVFSLVGAFTGVKARAFAFAIAGAGTLAAAGAFVSVYIAWQVIKSDEKHTLVRNIAVAFAAIGGTSFRGADLTDANFIATRLKSTDFRNAKLICTCFQNTKLLDRVRPGNSYLKHPEIRQLILTGQAQDKNFDRFILRGINLKGALLTDTSFNHTDLSRACLEDADLSRAKLVKTQLDYTDFTGATLTGAYIQNWNITHDTNFRGVKCEYVYMRLPTKENPNPLRKPDNNAELFADGEFGDFIQPIFDTLDLYHNQGVDPRAIAISFKELAENNPDAELEIVAMEKRGDDKFLLRAKAAPDVDKSELSAEYFETYNYLKSLSQSEQIQYLLTELKVKDTQINSQQNQIISYENMINTALGRPSLQAENYNNYGNTMSQNSKKESNFDLKGAQFGGSLVNADTVNAEEIGGNISNNDFQKQTENSTVKTILILASNPKNTSQLRLDEEVREIDAGLQRAKKRELFDLKQRWAVRSQEVYQALLDFKPQIVHFSGHGSGNDGLALEDENGNLKLVDTEAIAKLFELFSDTIECVVLNACYSEVQASAIAKYIPYVIGMNQAIGDKAAIKFATGFYNALSAGESVEFAYKLGCNVIQLDGIPEHLTPVLKTR